MNGLFSPHHVFSQGDEHRFQLELDAREPYLDHHRPNGTPLLASAMGIQAMIEAARLLADNDAPVVVCDAQILEPCLVSSVGRHTVSISVRPLRGLSEGTFDCSLYTASSADLRTTHHRAAISFGSRASATAVQPPPPRTPTEPRGADSGDIYAVYFHGPYYRVISHACWQDGAMNCRFAGGVAPVHRCAPSDRDIAPQVLELGLQSAGLWELARNERMMIPDRIARIEWSADLNLVARGPLHAIAQRSASRAGIDIDIVDASGAVHMTISGYGTVPLPFDIDRPALERLARRLMPTPPRNEFYGSCA